MEINAKYYDAVIIGNPDSIFVKMMADFWLSQGIRTVVVARSRSQDKRFRYSFDVLFSDEFESPKLRYILSKFEQKLKNLEKFILQISRARREKALGAEKDFVPLFLMIIINAISISKLVRRLQPNIVLGHEAYAFGLSVALCPKIPKAIMPWGGDIYLYAHTSFVAKMIVTYSLKHVDLIFPGSVSAVRYISQTYGVNEAKIIPVPWGVDINKISELIVVSKDQIRKKYGININDLVIINIRRLMPLWGCFESLNAFIAIAKKHHNTHFIMLGGGKKEYFLQIMEIIEKNGLKNRFTVFEDAIEYYQFVELTSIVDIFTSLMLDSDMRSSSVMQAAFICGVPVITDTKEYRLIKEKGFHAELVDPRDTPMVVEAIEKFIVDSNLRYEYKKRNREYILKYESYQKQMAHILDHVYQLCRIR